MKYSILDQTQLVEGMTAEEGFAQTIALAEFADKAGFERIWLSEHHSAEALAGSAPEVLAGYLLAKTNRIRIGSGGVMLPHYSTYKVAEVFKVLSGLAPGRVDLGVGRAPGGHRLSNFALQEERIRNVDVFPRQIDQVLEYLADELPKGHQMRGLITSPIVQQKPEMWVLGSSNSSGLLAAQKGLPYCFAHFISPIPGQMEQAFNLYLEHFKPSEYLHEPRLLTAIRVIIADTDEEAELLAASSFRVSLFLRHGHITRLVNPEGALEPLLNPSTELELEEIKSNFFYGSKATVKAQIKMLLADYPIDEVMAVSPMYDFEKRKHSFKLFKEIMEEL